MKVLFIGSNEKTYQRLFEMVSRHSPGIRRVQLSLEWADSLQAGLNALEENSFDVYLLDGTLDGRSAVDLLREIPGRGHSAPVIVLTGDGSEATARAFLENGAADVLLYDQLSLPLLERSILVALAARPGDPPRQSAETICLEVEKPSGQPASSETELDLPGWLDAVLQAVPVGVWISDGLGKVVRKNPAAGRILGEELPLHDSLLDLARALASHRAFLNFVLDQMPVGVSITGAPSGKGLYHNEQAVRLLGHSLFEGEDYTRYNSYRAVHTDGTPYKPEEYPSVRSILHGEVIRDECMLYRRGDEEVLFSVSSVPVVDSGGRRIAAVSTFYDITEGEHLLEENRRQRELLQAVFDADPAGLAVISGPDLTIRMANAAYRAVTLHPEIDPVGRPHDEVWPPEERFRPRPLLENVIEKGEPFSILKHERRLPDGTVRTYNYRVQPAVWEDKPAALVVLWDVTESAANQEQMRRAAQEAQERANELEALMDAVPAEVWIALDPECRQVKGNRTSFQVLRIPEGQNPSFTPGGGEGPGHFKVFSLGRQLAPEENPLQVAAREGIELHDFEKDIVFEDGEVRHLYGKATPLFDAEGKPRGAIAAFTDVTELIRAREEAERYAAQLERSNYDLEQFAYVASHDLQEPLRKIRFFGERLKEKFSSALEDDDVDYLNRMLSASQRMQTMISALLTYSRITTKAQPFVSVDLNQVVGEVVSDLEVRIVRSGGRVEVGSLPTLEADPMQMRQLFQNLIGNALKFQRAEAPPPLVRIYEVPSADRKKSKGKQVTICVEDNGIGIDERYLTRIFQPFERLHGRSEYEGSGMGLAICQKIAERHQGAITAASEVNKGSRFMITLPVRQSNV